jgi:phage shock protein E
MATKKHPSPQSRGRRAAAPVKPDRTKLYLGGAGVALVVVVAALMVAAFAGAFGGSGSGGSGTTGQTTVTISQGSYTNVTSDRLAEMLKAKDFTFVNVKTPYIGEIDGTDLYIPYTDLAARASELPQTKSAKILVYCRSGVESLEAVKTLLSLGYTNVWNLDGGMNAWQASGRTLVQKSH